jgi:hypothetical protein
MTTNLETRPAQQIQPTLAPLPAINLTVEVTASRTTYSSTPRLSREELVAFLRALADNLA